MYVNECNVTTIIDHRIYFSALVLGDQDKRAIYDIYGQKGLDANWEVYYINK